MSNNAFLPPDFKALYYFIQPYLSQVVTLQMLSLKTPQHGFSASRRAFLHPHLEPGGKP